MDYEKYFDNTAEDIKELKDWWEKDQSMEDCGYGNGHEWFMITGIPVEQFTTLIRALKFAEEEMNFHSYDTSISIGRDGKLVLDCNTAKDYEQNLLNHIYDQLDLLKDETPYYFEDQWDYPENVEYPKDRCKLVSLEIYSQDYLDDREYGYEDWDIRYVLEDTSSGERRGFGGGWVDREIVLGMWEDLKTLSKTDDYKEQMDPDIGYLTDPPVKEER